MKNFIEQQLNQLMTNTQYDPLMNIMLQNAYRGLLTELAGTLSDSVVRTRWEYEIRDLEHMMLHQPNKIALQAKYTALNNIVCAMQFAA